MYKVLQLSFFFLTMFVMKIGMAAEVDVGGYYKNILIRSRTLSLFPPAKSYQLDLNRLRLKLDGRLNDKVSFNIQYDNEILLGNYLATTQFTAIKNQGLDTYFDLDSNYINTNNTYAKQSIYRGYAVLALSDVDIRIGRQRIAWGTAMLWNPMDILNPFNPIQLEHEERLGIDAVLLDWNYDALSRLSLVYAQQRYRSSTAIRWRINQKGFDLSFMAGRFRGKTIAGFDFSGQLGNIGVKGEMTRTDPVKKDSYIQVVIGMDYTFTNTLSLNLEAYYNGQGSSDRSTYNFSRLFNGKIQSLARHYLGAYLGYDISPLLRWNNYLIFNFDDNSYFFAPNLSYSLSDNIEVSGGVQSFHGQSATEYGTLQNLYYLQFQWYF